MKKIDLRDGRDVEIELDKGEKIRIILEGDGGFFIAPMAGLFSFENGDVYVTERIEE